MTQYWEPGTQYNYDDIVEFEGYKYKIIQPHRSQSDWTPPVTPALWGRLQGHDNNQNQQHYNQPPAYPSPQGQPQQGWQQPNDQKVEQPQGEQKPHHWYDLDEKQKKQLEIGGGLAAGAALLAGGYALYNKHEKSKEQQQQQQQQQQQISEKSDHWYDDKRKLGLAAGAAAVAGGYAIHKVHEKHEEQQQEQQQQQIPENSDHWYDDKRKLGLAAGAAAVAGGYAIHKGHEKHEEQQRVSQYQNKTESTNEEQRTNWHNIDDHRKKQLEIAGGLAVGTALLAGGYALYKGHEKSEEQKKAQAWGLSNWANDAKTRTDQFERSGPTGPVTWILSRGPNIPRGAIEGGREGSRTLYICRAYFESSLQVGKASDAFTKGACIGYKHEEIEIDTYEILLGNMNALRWVPTHGKLNVNSLGYKPVEGGREDDGTPLYIAQAPYNDGVHPGKASEKLDGAYISYGGTERNVKEYRVLCYN